MTCKNKCNFYNNECLKDLDLRLQKIENKIKNKEEKELRWALNQFIYKELTEDERKALSIIKKALNVRKTPLR